MHRQGKVFENQRDLISVSVLDLPESRVNPAAEWTLKIGPLNDGDSRLLTAATGRAPERDCIAGSRLESDLFRGGGIRTRLEAQDHLAEAVRSAVDGLRQEIRGSEKRDREDQGAEQQWPPNGFEVIRFQNLSPFVYLFFLKIYCLKKTF
jgi:hypothetical protein